MTRVLIVTHDRVGHRMAGPAIRCLELGRQVARVADVTVASLLPLDGPVEAPFPVVSFEDDAHRLESLGRTADVLVVQGLMLRRYPLLRRLDKYLVVDLYDPFVFESYPYFLEQQDGGAYHFHHFWDILNEQMQLADFSICASDRQRDMWLGRYCAMGRLTPELFAADPSFRRLIDVVPFGVSDEPIQSGEPVLKGVVPGIRATDKVLLWGGGVWNWFDPLTVIRAVGAIARHRDDVKLYFLGIQHPNPEIPAMAMANQAVALAEALGLKDRHVFFNHGWVPYDDRQRYLAEADLGVSAHFESVETRFSFRTRVLDYLWAGLPIVTTEGDSMAELIDRHDLGAVVPYGSVDGWIAAIEGLLSDATRAEATSRRVRAMAESFRWSKVTEPLVRYCAAPYRTPPAPERIQERFLPPDQGRVLNLVHKGVRAWKLGGPSFFLKKGQRYVLDRLKRVERANG